MNIGLKFLNKGVKIKLPDIPFGKNRPVTRYIIYRVIKIERDYLAGGITETSIHLELRKEDNDGSNGTYVMGDNGTMILRTFNLQTLIKDIRMEIL